MRFHRVRRVILAPDSFKGSATALEAAKALAQGWAAGRPEDQLSTIPLADGGEGTLDVLAAAHPGHDILTAEVHGPDGRPVSAAWLLLPDGTAVVEVARAAGLPLMASPDALRASTFGFGELLAHATQHPATERLLVTLGGSATTDGAAGALQALGARLLRADAADLDSGGGTLDDLARIDLSGLQRPPAGGVRCLVDVTAPLLGPLGAAAQFGPQKGASPADVEHLEKGLAHLSRLLGGRPDQPGAGAAGGTAYTLATVWGAELVPGAIAIAAVPGLPAALEEADVVVTGEGRYDEQSLRGKVVGEVLDKQRGPAPGPSSSPASSPSTRRQASEPSRSPTWRARRTRPGPTRSAGSARPAPCSRAPWVSRT